MENINEVAQRMKNEGLYCDEEALIRYIGENYKLIRNEKHKEEQIDGESSKEMEEQDR